MRLVESLLFGLAQAISLQEILQDTTPTLGFTQTEADAEFSIDTCSTFHDRIKQGRNIFYSVQAGSAEYSDPSFPHDLAIRDPRDATGDLKGKPISWVDSIDVRFDDHKLFNDGRISAHDIRQGEIGNCWFIAAAAAAADKPGRLEKVFLNDSLSSNGIYGFQFYVLGIPTTITIDDSIPLNDKGNSIFSKLSKDKALWGPLLEKAFAKLNGTYESLISGDPKGGIQSLTGAPALTIYHDETNALDLFDRIKASADSEAMVTAGTPNSAGGDRDRSAVGLAMGHAYTVLSAHIVPNESGDAQRLVRIRNPWGTEDYNGPYSDDSTKWDQSLQDSVEYVDENDGTFFVDYQTYFNQFSDTVIAVDNSDMKQSFHLVQGDSTPDGYHKFTIKSMENQTIYITTHIWPGRTYPNECNKTEGSYKFLYKSKEFPTTRYDGDYTWYGFGRATGSFSQNKPIQVTAGSEIEVEMQFNWDSTDTKDFSLVVWGTGSQPTLITANTAGDTASRLPYTNEQENDANAATESGSDRCAVNPQLTGFQEWHKNLQPNASSCGGFGTWNTFGAGDFYYAFLGQCNFADLSVSFTLTDAAWADIWVGEGAKQYSAVPQGDGSIKKTFILDKDQDRVAFFVQGKHGIDPATLSPPLAQDDGCQSCTVYEKSGNDPADCPATTDGSQPAEVSPDTPVEEKDSTTTPVVPPVEKVDPNANGEQDALADAAVGRVVEIKEQSENLHADMMQAGLSAQEAFKLVTETKDQAINQAVEKAKQEATNFSTILDPILDQDPDSNDLTALLNFQEQVIASRSGVAGLLSETEVLKISSEAQRDHEFTLAKGVIDTKWATFHEIKDKCQTEIENFQAMNSASDIVGQRMQQMTRLQDEVVSAFTDASDLVGRIPIWAGKIDEAIVRAQDGKLDINEALESLDSNLADLRYMITAVQELTPPPPAGETDDGVCQDLDTEGQADSYGDVCAGYSATPSWCNDYDDEDFISATLCCACGGGSTGSSSPAEASTEADATVETPPSVGTCVDTDNGKLDSFSDPCSSYYGNPSWCGLYDDEDFKSNEMCCECSGGSTAN